MAFYVGCIIYLSVMCVSFCRKYYQKPNETDTLISVLHPTFKTPYDHYCIIKKKLRFYSEYCETSRISCTLLRYFRLPVHIHEDFGWEEVGSDAFFKFADYSQNIWRIFTIAKL